VRNGRQREERKMLQHIHMVRISEKCFSPGEISSNSRARAAPAPALPCPLASVYTRTEEKG